MKLEIVGSFEDVTGIVTGTIATGDDGTLAAGGAGAAVLTAVAFVSDPDTNREVRPCDGDAVLLKPAGIAP